MTNVTILCANRPRLLRQALFSIGELKDATMTIRDAGMNKGVRDIVYEWQGPRKHWITSTEAKGTGPARNSVIRESELHFGRGEFLVLSDDDVYFLHDEWLRILINAYRKSWDAGFRVIGAYNHPFNGAIGHFPILEGGYVTCTVDEVYAVATQSMLMKWEVWDEFGPFCETPAGKVCQSEDVDFCNRIRAKGFKVGVISPPLLVNTGITNSFGEKIPGWELVKSQCPEGVLCE